MVLPAVPDPEADRYLPVTATGEAIAAPLRVLVSARGFGPAYRLIYPFRTEGGRGVMVDMGLVRTDVPVPDLADRLFDVTRQPSLARRDRQLHARARCDDLVRAGRARHGRGSRHRGGPDRGPRYRAPYPRDHAVSGDDRRHPERRISAMRSSGSGWRWSGWG